jgi:hypothetical protein
MRIMLDCSPEKIAEYSEKYGYEFWQLRTPLTQYRQAPVPYGVDNGCFSQFKRSAWETLLSEAEKSADRDHPPKFITLPDCVGSATRTLDLYRVFRRRLFGLPVGLVLQDGIGQVQIPWDEIDAVFVGGSDVFKTSKEAVDACRVARMLGKWVHVGRVNSAQRAIFWRGLADSCDGSGVSRFDDRLEVVLDAILHRNEGLDLQSVDDWSA